MVHPACAILDDGVCERVERPTEEDSVCSVTHDVHLEIERNVGPRDDERHVLHDAQGSVDRAVHGFHPKRVRRVVNEMKAVAKPFADRYNLTPRV